MFEAIQAHARFAVPRTPAPAERGPTRGARFIAIRARRARSFGRGR